VGEMTTFLALNRNKRKRGHRSQETRRPGRDARPRSPGRRADSELSGGDRGFGSASVMTGSTRSTRGSSIAPSPATVRKALPTRAGQDLILQGYSGSMRSVGRSVIGRCPSALWAADVMSGYQAVIGVLAALQARGKSGQGQ